MIDIIKADDNIFNDLQVSEPEEALAKAALARKIHKIITLRKLTQVEAAAILNIKQPDVSDLIRGRLHKFSMDRLMHLLNLLDWDVEIVVRKKRGKSRRGITHVIAA
ncbi:helix-turn-helix domain-containing protein [Candidatus Odyssella thessalonicensis]|uniref:helix-turn-helix domain-containing protein n=1 Tax=Candidatus Odyssella thessalonicensis TaxID=84647 RepID=UPI000225A9AB|nr:helix-turn-helix transcriptional regulator [Candidatus Odyssella thessalonicensis]